MCVYVCVHRCVLCLFLNGASSSTSAKGSANGFSNLHLFLCSSWNFRSICLPGILSNQHRIPFSWSHSELHSLSLEPWAPLLSLWLLHADDTDLRFLQSLSFKQFSRFTKEGKSTNWMTGKGWNVYWNVNCLVIENHFPNCLAPTYLSMLKYWLGFLPFHFTAPSLRAPLNSLSTKKSFMSLKYRTLQYSAPTCMHRWVHTKHKTFYNEHFYLPPASFISFRPSLQPALLWCWSFEWALIRTVMDLGSTSKEWICLPVFLWGAFSFKKCLRTDYFTLALEQWSI